MLTARGENTECRREVGQKRGGGGVKKEKKKEKQKRLFK
jgi:hypothetical protein